MPHITVEYTANIPNEANINDLLIKANQSLISHKDTFSPNGIRSRAIKLTNYVIGDGANDGAFVHVTLQIASGRTAEVRKAVLDHLFTTIESHFEEMLADKHIALSLHISELNGDGNMYKQN